MKGEIQMKKIKEIIIGLSFMWLPLAGCYVAEIICKMLGVN